MTPKFKYRPVEVVWVDSEHNSDWSTLEDVVSDDTSMECRSCGYLVADKEDRVVLATSITASDEVEEQVSAYIVIPKAAISSIKELRKR